MFNSSTMSPADFAAMSNDGFSGSNSWVWLLLILLLVGNGTWGNNGGVQDQYTLASDFATLQRQIDSTAVNTQNLVTSNGDALQRQVTSVANGISSLGYDQLGQFNNVNQNINSAVFGLTTQLNNIASNQQSCCCSTQNAITSGFADTNYRLATDTCAINTNVSNAIRDVIDNDNANYRSLDARLTSMEMSAKDDKIAELSSQVSALQLAASQQAQNAYLINQLKPAPVPSYPASSVYGYCSCSSCS